MKLSVFRESHRDQFPSHEFYAEMIKYFNAETIDVKTRLLKKFGYTNEEMSLALERGIENSSSKNNGFSKMAWHFYDTNLIKTEIINTMDLANFYEWESMADQKKCIVCGQEFDYRDYREKRLQRKVCDEHLIKDRTQLKPDTKLYEISEDLQQEYWGKITDDTLGELIKSGVVAKN